MTIAGWTGTLALIAALLALDLLVSARRTQPIALRAALCWSLFYVLAALLFGAVFGVLAGWELGAQYFAAYLVEKSLSVDNLFVFAVLLASFAVPHRLQPRALSIGIALALLLRGAMIAAGAALISAFSVTFLFFGCALLLSSVQLLRQRGEDAGVRGSAPLSLARRALPLASDYHGSRLWIKRAGRRVPTRLFLVLLAIGSADVLFALDSIPAVFGVTRHAYIVFAANAFALLGLRALYFLLSGLLERLTYMSIGLAAILGFIGVKLILHFAHGEVSAIPEVPTGYSLAVIALVLAGTVLASLLRARREPDAGRRAPGTRAHASARRSEAMRGPLRGALL